MTKVSEIRTARYGEKEMRLIEEGTLDELAQLLAGKDMSVKESLLLALDRYLDPWFGYNLPQQNDIFRLLEKELWNDANNEDVMEDLVMLLVQYCPFPLDALKANRTKVTSPEVLKEMESLLDTWK
ncbi:hypothetical protein [Leminorella grimontii]|uniref:hypothetical protein n=1 Tax=Leminorella grimontii TaxID=82981 RepID=UPI00207E18F2|nr:hypothetical protein [Leminorella grimontii]GKX59699.1 hypothetical protein SOASR031_20140 [Leminorella grimontii]